MSMVRTLNFKDPLLGLANVKWGRGRTVFQVASGRTLVDQVDTYELSVVRFMPIFSGTPKHKTIDIVSARETRCLTTR
jgi:hypothetical protein